jgi:hypothetical protein
VPLVEARGGRGRPLSEYLSLSHSPSNISLLYTGASLYAPYSLLLISNKIWMGGGGRWGVGGRGGRVGGGELKGWSGGGVEGWKGGG